MPDEPHRPIIGVTYNSEELDKFLLWRHMFNGVVAAGGTPVAIDCRLPVPHAADLAARLDGVVVSGGGDVHPDLYGGDAGDPVLRGIVPARDDAEAACFRTARENGRPVLAICRGAQLVNVLLGGTLHQDLVRDLGTAVEHRRSEEALIGPLHTVDVAAGSRLESWLGSTGTVGVNSQHHQGIRDLAPGLTATAWAPDGLVEAYEDDAGLLLAVQWHPEVLWATDAAQLRLLTAFVRRCAVPAARTEGELA